MVIVTADMEGVFTPEIWINVAERTGIEELRLTTRDISDYDVLMKKRLAILRANHLKLTDIQAVIATMNPLAGARSFLDWMRARAQVIIVSDTYVEFAGPLLKKLGWPTLFCHDLSISADGMIASYNLRSQNAKYETVQALQSLNYRIIALGDSYNDVQMLQAAEQGILFKPPENVAAEFPELPVATTYEQARELITGLLEKLS